MNQIQAEYQYATSSLEVYFVCRVLSRSVKMLTFSQDFRHWAQSTSWPLISLGLSVRKWLLTAVWNRLGWLLTPSRNRMTGEGYEHMTHSTTVHTEQQKLEQLEHCRVQEGQAWRSHWEHRLLLPWIFWHTQQPAGPAGTPGHKAHTYIFDFRKFQLVSTPLKSEVSTVDIR